MCGTPTWPEATFPHSSSVPCTEKNSNFTVIDERENSPFHATGSCSPDQAYKLCWLTNGRAGRPVGSQNKRWPLQAVDRIQHSLLTSKGVSIITTLFGHTANSARHPAKQCWPAIPSTAMGPAASHNRTSTKMFPATAALYSSPLCILSSASPISIPSPTVEWSTLLVWDQ